jgi:hypothetical protein
MHRFQVGKPASFGFIMGMGDIVAGYRSLATDFAYFRHDFLLLSPSPSQWQTVEVECMDDVRANNESESVLLTSFYKIGKHFSSYCFALNRHQRYRSRPLILWKMTGGIREFAFSGSAPKRADRYFIIAKSMLSWRK